MPDTFVNEGNLDTADDVADDRAEDVKLDAPRRRIGRATLVAFTV
jgi:hypothetical protein